MWSATRPLVEQVCVVDDRTRWVDVISYSSRTRSKIPIGGLVGSVTLEGELASLRELLVNLPHGLKPGGLLLTTDSARTWKR
jgi:hypothetical protein